MNKNLRLFMTALLCAVFGTVGAIDVTDVLNRATTGVTGTNYTDWSGKQLNSAAVYAGNSAGGNDAIQLRSNNSNSGIITTASGGTVKSVTVTWEANTADGRTLNVYGSNEAYTSPGQLYGENSGTLLGTIKKGESTKLEITGEYAYIGLRSASGAMYLTDITIVWDSSTPGKPVPKISFKPTSITVLVGEVVGEDIDAPTLTYEGDGTITYSSSDENVATVVDSSTGVVDVIASGEVTITATAAETSNYRSASASYTINAVNKRTPTMKFSPNYINYFLDDTFTAPELTYDGDGTVTYSSDKEEVATVNATTGVVTINGIGKAVITATATETANYFGAEATYTINAAEPQGTHEVEDGTFDFTDATDYGTGLTPSAPEGSDPETFIWDDKTWTAGNVKLVSSGKYRWWLNASGNELRFYNNKVDDVQTSKMTISVPDGYVITNIAITGGQQFASDDGKYTSSNGKWEGEAQSVTLRYAAKSGNVGVKTVTVTYKSGTTPPNPGLTVCENIAAFKALESDTEAELKLVNAEVLYAKGKDVYVHDESGAIEFYNLGLNLENNQVLNGSVIGKFSPYHNLPEIVKTDNTNANNLTIVEASDAEPLELTLAQAQDMQYVCELVSFENVNIVEADGSFSLSDGQSTLAIYDKFSIGLAAASNIKVAGILVIYDDTYQLNPITVDYGELPDPELAWSVETLEVVLGDDFTQPTLSAAEGFDLSTVTYSSSNASVAKMEEGALVIVGPGTAVITAKANVSSTFAAGSAEFTVIVTRPTPVASGKYILVTDVATLANGDEVIIVGANTPKVEEGEEPVTNYYALGTNQKNNNREAVSVTMNADGTITGNTDVQVITLEEGWYLNVGNGYLYAAGSNKNNYLRTEDVKDEDNNAKADITITDGVTKITFQGTNTNSDMRFNYNNGTPLFACYAPTNTTQVNVSIYRKVADSILLGDANGDGAVNIADVTVTVDYVLTGDSSFIKLENANVNGDFTEDGTPDVNITDVTLIVNLILSSH